MVSEIEGKTSAELREMARECDRREQESFERSDTDGFLSQWASGLTGRLYRLAAELHEAGGKAEYRALFDLDGNLVAAKEVETRYGWSWGILESDDPHSKFVAWFRESHASTIEKQKANNAKKGYYVGTVRAAAKAAIGGSGTGLSGAANAYAYAKRIDGGFSRDVEIVDNGK